MDYNVLEAQYVRDYVVWLRFRDGTAGEVDLGPELWGEVFEPLKSLEYFKGLGSFTCASGDNERPAGL